MLLALLVAIVSGLYLIPIPLWIAAWDSARIGLMTLIRVRLRRVPPGTGHGAHQRGESRLDIPLTTLRHII